MKRENEALMTPARELADFAAGLRFESIPRTVVERTEDLFLDWFASALAGKGARPVEILAAFYASQGPTNGPSEILIHRTTSSPMMAAAINAASTWSSMNSVSTSSACVESHERISASVSRNGVDPVSHRPWQR